MRSRIGPRPHQKTNPLQVSLSAKVPQRAVNLLLQLGTVTGDGLAVVEVPVLRSTEVDAAIALVSAAYQNRAKVECPYERSVVISECPPERSAGSAGYSTRSLLMFVSISPRASPFGDLQLLESTHKLAGRPFYGRLDSSTRGVGTDADRNHVISHL